MVIVTQSKPGIRTSRPVERFTIQPLTIAYHISHASGAFLHPVDGSTVKLFQGGLSLGQELVWEVTVKQHLLPVTGQSQHRDTCRDLEWNERAINKNVHVFRMTSPWHPPSWLIKTQIWQQNKTNKYVQNI